MSLTFDDATHTYELDGAVVPSVTQILRASGVVDFSAVPGDTLAAALDRGTAVHRALHYHAEGDFDVDGFYREFPEYAGYLRSGVLLLDSSRVRTVLCERRVASRKHRFAGTIDWLGYIDGQAAILDWSTGDARDAGKNWQTGAYHCAALEWADVDPQLGAFVKANASIARFSVRLRKDGALPSVTPYRDPRDLTEFLTLLSARRIVEVHKGRQAAYA